MPRIAEPAVAAGEERKERYVREAPIGRGACADVYRARDTYLGRTVALKVVRFDPGLTESGRRELQSRSEREARAAGALNHPHIVTIHDAGPGSEAGTFEIVMEYVGGTNLKKRLARGPLPPAEAARIGLEVALALDYAHRRGVVHRDVKPANIMIGEDGRCKLADFGIARVEGSDLTATGDWVGSPAYMSPEQALGERAGPAADLFALGAVLYEMLSGERLFGGETLAELTHQILNRRPEPLSAKIPGVSSAWDGLLAHALAREPERRFGSAGEMAEVLASLADTAEALPLSDYEAPETDLTDTEVKRLVDAGASLREGSAPTLIPVEEGPRDAAEATARSIGRRLRILRLFIAAAALLVLASTVWPGFRTLVFGPPPATLHVEVVHGLGSGEITLEVDGEPVWTERLYPIQEESRIRPFVRGTGRFPPARATAAIPLGSGDRVITVRVESVEGSWSETVERQFEGGVRQRLEVQIRTGLTSGLGLHWAS